jgi:hypothetical protein
MDADGHVWLAPTPEAGARFRADEIPPPLRQEVAVRGLEVRPLLDDLLADHDLTWGRLPDPAVKTYEVSAVLRGKAWPLRLAAAELTIDRDTLAVCRLALRRRLPAGGMVAVTFTLVTTAERPDAFYTPEAHLNPGAPVHGADRPVLRTRVLLRGLARFFANGL